LGDIIEVRLDDLKGELPLEPLQNLIQVARPVILTLRSRIEGGGFLGGDLELMRHLSKLAALKPAYLDVERRLPTEWIEKLARAHPEVTLILSSHAGKNAREGQALYQPLEARALYKISYQASSATEALEGLIWSREIAPKPIVIPMGERGAFARILAPLFQLPMTYASLSDKEQTAPGQMPAAILRERYHYHQLNRATALFGLIGDPVSKSISDVTHNRLLREVADACYVKMDVTPDELPAFLPAASRAGFQGMSVTTPLKEAIVPLLDEIDEEATAIGAVNTLAFKEGKIIGYNTDGRGALRAIEKKVATGGAVALIGSGGAAKAIAYALVQAGYQVTIFSRDLKRAEEIATRLVCQGQELSSLQKSFYDLLINCTPLSLPIEPKEIRPGSICMDIQVQPKETLFLKAAEDRGCDLIYGYEMFSEQAALQFDLWFNGQFDLDLMREGLLKQSELFLSYLEPVTEEIGKMPPLI
jgi:3-dehydroquinate dehydratase/shikimate dehydrogenase